MRLHRALSQTIVRSSNQMTSGGTPCESKPNWIAQAASHAYRRTLEGDSERTVRAVQLDDLLLLANDDSVPAVERGHFARPFESALPLHFVHHFL